MTSPSSRSLRSSLSSSRQINGVENLVRNELLLICTILFASLAVRLVVGLHPYSGEDTPPMYGDYEAQRHWMEITRHLPAKEWYTNSTDNDLSYWGLDYPPLSAYASKLFASFLAWVEEPSVELKSSHGYQSARSRNAMRLTVIAADIALFFPAVLLLSSRLYPAASSHRRLRAVVFTLTTPGLILIDHAHFQYNNVSLALLLLAVCAFINRYDSIGTALFCASIYFKHMGLYYAPAIFAFLMSRLSSTWRSCGTKRAISFSMKMMTSVVATTVLIFWPWIGSHHHLRQLLARLVPISRGLYEDKVANVWCTLSPLLKLPHLLSSETLFSFCAVVTTLACAPFCIAVGLKPTPTRLLLSAAGSALSAFLFSYQVHEKQILLPLLPIAMMYPVIPSTSIHFSHAATASLFPLLWRERSHVAYIATLILHAATIPFMTLKDNGSTTYSYTRLLYRGFILASVAIGVALQVALMALTPPTRFPHLFELANTSYASLHFCVTYMRLLAHVFEYV